MPGDRSGYRSCGHYREATTIFGKELECHVASEPEPDQENSARQNLRCQGGASTRADPPDGLPGARELQQTDEKFSDPMEVRAPPRQARAERQKRGDLRRPPMACSGIVAGRNLDAHLMWQNAPDAGEMLMRSG